MLAFLLEFYDNFTRQMWPSILHAAAMWLNKLPFRETMDKVTDMTNEDRLFLSIGLYNLNTMIYFISELILF